ncbi:hypothetical protein JCM33374_g3261 [Metschnikowia sp. JCM 33374]|nr:hypothetical protein JCM33374_g3261 [Metschnikowia sp. JCM 33374]
MTADTVIIFDSDWNPQADLQAMARAHRIGQTRHVSVYRFVSKDTVEEEILERARKKMILEYAIISLGMTDAGSSKKNKNEPTSSELSQILKFGAANMFAASDNQKKLEDLNLDDVLSRAEDHVTTPDLGESNLGSEEFLKQFEVTDYKADVEWDDIIPQDELTKLKEEEKKKAEETYLNDQIAIYSRRRAAVKKLQGDTPDTSGVEDDEEEEGGRRKAAKKKAEEHHELSEREIRGIYRAILKVGDLSGKWNQLVEDGSISNKNPVLIKHAYNEIITMSKKLVREEEARRTEALAELERKAKDSKITNGDGENATALWLAKKKEKKAVLFEYQGVKNINAELVLSRPPDMKLLETLIPPDKPQSFELPRMPKQVSNWNCEWSPKDDAMLLLGVHKFGYGSWTQIRDDPILGLQNKLYLEGTAKASDKKEGQSETGTSTPGQEPDGKTNGEAKPASAKNAGKKVPGPVHLGRRVDYLFTILRGEEEIISAAPQKKRIRKVKTELPVSKDGRKQNPGPESNIAKPKVKKNGGETTKARASELKSKQGEVKSPQGEHMKIKPEKADDDDFLEYASMDEAQCKATLKPVAKSLMKLHKGNKGLDKHEWAALLRQELGKIGDFIENPSTNGSDEKTRKHLWSYASLYWPARVPSAKINAMYTRIRSSSEKKA